MQDATLGLKLPTTADHPSYPDSVSAGEWGTRAEELGYDSVWLSEGWGVDALVSLAEVAIRTEDIRLCTAIVNTYSRTPAVLAMAGATLQRLSDGRAVLGVGPSHAGTIEPLHGMEYTRPVRRTHETIELIKALTSGTEEVTYRGEIHEVEGYPAFEASVPVYNAALGEANRRATGRVADGWLPYLFPVSALGDAFETVRTTAREAGRDPDDIEVTPQILAAVDDDPAKAKDHIRGYVARYLGNYPNYRNILERSFPEATDPIVEAWESDGFEAARDRVPDEMVLELGVAGPPETAREQLEAVIETPVVDCPIVYVPRGVSEDTRDETIEELSPERL